MDSEGGRHEELIGWLDWPCTMVLAAGAQG